MISVKEILEKFIRDHNLQYRCHLETEGITITAEPICPCRNCGEAKLLLSMVERGDFQTAGLFPWVINARARAVIELDVRKAMFGMPNQLEGEDFRNWFNVALNQIQKAYAQLGDTDALIHTDALNVAYVLESTEKGEPIIAEKPHGV